MEHKYVRRFSVLVFCFVLTNIGEIEGKDTQAEQIKDREESFSLKKTIKNENGDVFDCVDINSQPAMRYPLLKNHIIQMKPSSIPTWKNKNKSSFFGALHTEIYSNNVTCPYGTIPIWRNPNKNSSYSIASNLKFFNNHNDNDYTAGITSGQDVFGTRASITVYEPDVKLGNEERYSGALALVRAGWFRDKTDLISAGWFVFPKYFGDQHAHFSIMWMESTHSPAACLNLECGGFVQVSSDFALGSRLSPVSVYGGNQYSIIVHLFMDPKTGDWWLAFGAEKKLIGYWPKSLFKHMGKEFVWPSWVGLNQGPPNESSLPMGSGHYATEGYRKSAFFSDIVIVDKNNNFVVPNTFWTKTAANKPSCYNVDKLGTSKTGMGFFFGGPAGCKG